MSINFPTTPSPSVPGETVDLDHTEIPRAFYADVPPLPPPDDPHWREWPPEEPSEPMRQNRLDELSDRTTLRWIVVLFVAAIVLHILVMALVLIVGHPG
jgi:hypothetical protein